MDRQQPYSLTNQLTDEEKQILSDWKKMCSVCKDREDCLFGNYPTLQEMNNNCRGSGLAAISKCLDLMNVYTNYRAKLNLMQTLMLSQTIFDKFFYLKDTELMLFFSDFYKYMNSDEFYGSIEPKTITTMLTNWVRVKRGAAIEQHDKKLHRERIKAEKDDSVSWEQYCMQNELDEKESPIGRISAGFGRKTDKETDELIRKSAEELVNNRWGYDKETMEKARKSFMTRYKSTPEYVLGKE